MYRNRLMNGFVPVGNRHKGSIQQLVMDMPPKSPGSHADTGADREREAAGIDYPDPSAGVMSPLVGPATIGTSPSTYLSFDSDSPKPAGDFVDVSSAVVTDNVSANSAEWSLGLLPDGKGLGYEFQDSTSKDLVPMTFVSCNPLEPVAASRLKRGPFRNDQLREETNKTRQLKACVRCRMQKARVSHT